MSNVCHRGGFRKKGTALQVFAISHPVLSPAVSGPGFPAAHKAAPVDGFLHMSKCKTNLLVSFKSIPPSDQMNQPPW